MGKLQFGGRVATVMDPHASVSLQPRCSGSVNVAFDPPEDFKIAARTAILRHVGEALATTLRSVSFLSIDNDALARVVGDAVSRELGVPMQLEFLQLGLSEEDSEALTRAAAKIAAARRAQVVAAGPACPRCGATSAGKFCAHCGSAMSAAAPAPPPTPVAPSAIAPPAGDWLTSAINHPVAATSSITVPEGLAFVGFVNGALAVNLRAGQHVLQQTCDKACYIRLAGMPFSFDDLVKDRGRLRFRGTLYVQDPVAQFRDMQTIDPTFVDMLKIVLGRCADQVSARASNERALCEAVALAYASDSNGVKGTVVVFESIA